MQISKNTKTILFSHKKKTLKIEKQSVLSEDHLHEHTFWLYSNKHMWWETEITFLIRVEIDFWMLLWWSDNITTFFLLVLIKTSLTACIFNFEE